MFNPDYPWKLPMGICYHSWAIALQQLASSWLCPIDMLILTIMLIPAPGFLFLTTTIKKTVN